MRTFAQYTNGDVAILLNNDPVWLSIIKIVVVFVFLMVMAMLCVWGERRILGKMQHRPGPNRVGPFGLLQALADGLKVAFKEDIRPLLADKFVYMIAPVIAAVPAFLAFAVTPFGGQVSMFGHQTALQITDLPVGVLVVLACSSVGVYGIVLGGWSSGSPYPLLSALRSAAQVISYEIAMGLSLVAVIVFSHSLSTADIVNAQSSGWYAWLLPGIHASGPAADIDAAPPAIEKHVVRVLAGGESAERLSDVHIERDQTCRIAKDHGR